MGGNDSNVLLTLDIDIVAANAGDIKSKLKDAITDDMDSLVLDFNKVDQVDSVGMGVLIATFNSLKKKGKGFKITGVDEKIYDLFQVMRLNKHFEIEVKEA
ncbi:STAS domain-containing protein [Desulfonatronovibrio magnus]|uniref:STAS domain-containing protein n=1 Tax=Desulfonatronovibrio magnus TaxID=698827 RepID=UPI0005EBD8E8|nr:STAS domain-containing protein [Desulfonatronovibrio magnus]